MTEQYQPQYRVHGTTTWSNWGSPITTTSAIIGQNPPGPALTPSTQYDFQVVASNSFGSAASAIISATTSATTSISSISLSNQSFTAGAAQGTVVGAITVTMSSGTFSGSLSVAGTDASFFQISGGNLVLSGTATTARTYNINIVATQTGISNSPFTQNFPSITAAAASQESAEGFIVNTVGPIMFASTTAGSVQNTGPWNQFALVTLATNSPGISLNGVTQSGPNSVSELIYHNHTAYQENTSLGWWRWDTITGTWIEFGASAVSLSGSSYAANASVNTLIGTISVTMLDGTAFNGTLAVNDTTHFKIIGSQLQAATTLTATSYPITITAVPAVSGANKIGEQGTLSSTITQTGTGTVTAPTQAANAGFTSLVFSDDFTTSNTIATTIGATSGFKWYWSINNPSNNGGWTVLPTTSASGISNGNSGGGSNASSAGGILRIDTGGFPSNGNIQTAPNGLSSVPALGTGNWRHMYVEAYLQFKIDGNLITDPSNGWVGFWMWDTADFAGLGTGSTSGSQGTSTELDIMESYGTIFGNTPGNWDSTWHSPGGANSTAGVDHDVWAFSPPAVDNNWHTWGCLWTPGTISTYLDNTLIGSFSTTTHTPDVENQGVIVILGTGNSWAFHVDWVRVWQ